MPRAKIETAFLGAYTIVALDAATENVAGWLIKRLCAWILRDELPDAIPPELASVWAVIEAESRNLHDYRKSKDEARTEAAKTAAEGVSGVVSSHIIASPTEDTEKMLKLSGFDKT